MHGPILVCLGKGIIERLLEVANFYCGDRISGFKICCLEEIACCNRVIDEEKLTRLAKPLFKSEYGQYIFKLFSEKVKKHHESNNNTDPRCQNYRA